MSDHSEELDAILCGAPDLVQIAKLEWHMGGLTPETLETLLEFKIEVRALLQRLAAGQVPKKTIVTLTQYEMIADGFIRASVH